MADDVVGLRYISEGLPEMLREIKSYQTAVSGVQRAERQKASATKESSRATSQNTQETKKAAQAEKEWFALQRQRVQLRQNSARLEERAIQQVAQAQRAQDAADRAAYQRYIRYQNEKAAAAQRSVREQARAAEQAAAAERRLAAEKDRLTAKFNPLYAASKQYERALNEIARAQQIGALNAKQHEAAVEQLNMEFQAFQSGTAGWSNQFATGAQRGAREVNRMGMVMQQTGYQVGDFLVQVQSGTNWMVAFGQQATQLAGLVGLVNPALIGVGAALGIIIPLVTALGAAWMRTRGAAEEAALAFKDVSGSLTTLEDVRLARLGEGFANNAERASDAFKEILATVERVAAVNLRAQLLAPLEAVLDEIRRFDTQSNLQSRVGGEADFESSLGLKSRQEAVFLAQQLRTLEGDTREELLQQADAIAEALRLRGIMTPQVDALLKSLADELGLMEAITSEQSQQTDGFAAQKTEMEQQIALQRMALQFGEDSLAVRRLENQQAQENLATRLREQGLTDEQVSTLVEMLRVQQSNAEALRQSEAAAGGLNSKLSEATGLAATLLNILGNVPAALAGLAGQVDGVLSSLERQNAELNYQLTQGLSASAASVKALRDEALATAAANGATIDELARVGAAFDEKAAKAEALSGSLEKNRKALQAQTKAASGSGKAAKSAASDIDDLADEVERLNRAADPFANYAAGLKRLTELSRAGLSDAAYSVELERMNEELVKADPLLSDVNDAFGQMVDYMFDGFKDGMAGIWDIFKNTLKQMIATAAKSRITIGLGMAATGGAGAAAAALPGGGGILSNLLPGVFGGGGALSGIGSGLMGVFSGGGLGSSFANLGGLLSGSVSGWGAVGAALPAVGLLVGVPLALGALFKKTEVLVAEGVRARIDGASLELDSYEKTKTNNGFGMSSGFDREFERLDDAVQSAVGARLDATIDALGAFGLGTDLTGFQFSKRTEVKDGETFEGESEEVIREALNAAVEYLAEGALELYQQAGEGLSDTLTRLSTAIQVVNPLVDRLGNHMLDMSLDGAAAASALIEAAGGLEAFAAETAFVFENFTLDAEKAHIAADELGIQMRALGVDTIPATHAAFMELVNAQDLATEGGREMYAALLDIAPLFVQVKGTAQEAADAALNQANANDDLTNSSNDAAAAARELAAQQREQESLLLQIARMTGNVAYIREQELAALNEANRPLQEYIYLLEDQAAALEATEAALRTALNTANDLVATMEGNLADANRDLEAAYADLDRVVNDRLQTLRDERQGYLDTAEAARQALITLGAITEAKTPLQEAEDAARAYEDALSQLGAAISRERSTLEANIADWNAELEEISNRVYEESQALLDAQAGYDTALNNLSAGISRERSALESEADRLRAALFPNEGQDLVAALETRDVMGETLGIAERLANAAREVFRLNEDVVAQQRTAALAQLRAMLASGQVDGANLDRVISDATSFDSRQFATFEEMSFAQKETGNILMDLSALQESIATQAQNKEDLRAEEARQVALDQLSALEDQIAGLDALADRFGLLQEELSSGQLATLADQQLAALDKARAEDAAAWAAQQAADDIRRVQLNDQIREAEKRLDELRDIEVAVGLVTTELATGAIFTEVGLLKGEAEAAKLAAIEYYTEEQQRAQDAADAAQDQIDALQSQYDALRDVEAAVNTVEGAIAQLASAQAAQAKALQDLADAQAAADAAQDAVDQATGGGSGGDVTSGMSSAEKRLYGILDALDGAQGAALLGADAFGQFSEDNMNAMLTNAAIAALTGSAADVAGAYADELGRNADVAGLVAYVGALESGFFDLAGVAADLAKSTEAITGIIPGFAIPGVDTGGGSSSGGSSSGGGGSSSGGGASSGDGGMPEGWERPNGYVAALFGTYGVPWSESQYQNWLDKYDDRDALYGGLIGFTDAWKAAFEDDFGEVPSYRNGTDYHPGGWARLHENEMVNLPRGTSVSTAGEVREMVEELKASRKQNEANAAELRQMRRLLTELADIEGDRRAEELSA